MASSGRPLAATRELPRDGPRDIENGLFASRAPRGRLAAAREPANRRPGAAAINIEDEEGCADLPLPPATVVSVEDGTFLGAVEDRRRVRPWAADLPDGSESLPTGTHHDGNEIRRSQADGLVGAGGRTTFRAAGVLAQPLLVPFASEERGSHARNAAG